MLSFDQVNILGNILNTTWGRGINETFSCKGEMSGDNLMVTYSTIIYYASSEGLNAQAGQLMEESNARINDLVKKLKSEYKDETGETLTLKELSNKDSYDITQASSLNPRKVAVYRRKVVLQVA